MSRWAPDARERLQAAALELFAERGYDETTVAQIADRAGLNRATFFRHFADKRETLFGGEELLGGLFGDAIKAEATDASLTDCLKSALAAAEAVLTPEQRAMVEQRRSIAATSVEVQERGLQKHARIAHAVAAALAERGVDELTAKLAAELLLLAFGVALERWITAPAGVPFAALTAPALDDFADRAAALGGRRA